MSFKMRVEKVATFKSGKFVFSSLYDEGAVRPLVERADLAHSFLAELPILPDAVADLERLIIRKSIHGTVALEGNPLSEEEVSVVLEGQKNTPRHLRALGIENKAELEAYNIHGVFSFLFDRKDDGEAGFPGLDEASIRVIHELVTMDLRYEQNTPGAYRNIPVKVGSRDSGGVFTPPKCLPDIQKLMGFFVKWFGSKSMVELHPLIRGAMAHYYLGKIHPFADGNGRVARAVEAWILTAAGYKYFPLYLWNYYYKNVRDYYAAFRDAQKSKEGDLTPFVSFMLRGVNAALDELRASVHGHIRVLTLRTHYETLRKKKEISLRQFDLLSILLELDKPVSLDDLYGDAALRAVYRTVSLSTARRDLKKLGGMGLLQARDGTYSLNFDVPRG